jgi:hypothetical protein
VHNGTDTFHQSLLAPPNPWSGGKQWQTGTWAVAGGLATSPLLANYRVSFLLVERRREVFIYPEARNITFGQFSTYACSMVIGVTTLREAVRREAEHWFRQFSLAEGASVVDLESAPAVRPCAGRPLKGLPGEL